MTTPVCAATAARPALRILGAACAALRALNAPVGPQDHSPPPEHSALERPESALL